MFRKEPEEVQGVMSQGLAPGLTSYLHQREVKFRLVKDWKSFMQSRKFIFP